MKFKKYTVCAAASVISILMFSVSMFGANIINIQTAKVTAEKYVPSGSTNIESKDDHGEFEFKFYNKEKNEKYDIDIDKTSGKIISYESEAVSDKGSNTISITLEQAKKIVTDENKSATVMSAKLDYDDKVQTYEIMFYTNDYYGEININPESGKIIKRDIKTGTINASTENFNVNNLKGNSIISFDDISKKVLEEIPNGIITDIDLKTKGEGYIYKIEVYKDNIEHELVFDAVTGNKISSNGNLENKSYIGLEKAKEIALKKVPKAVMQKIELDLDDGIAVYEGEMRNGRMEYEFKIDAVTGNILEWDEDFDD